VKLTDEEHAILAGRQGEAMKLALRTLVRYGEAFGADCLLPISSAHLAGSFAVIMYKTYYRALKMMKQEGLRVKVLTTVNPLPAEAPSSLANRLVFSRQRFLDEHLAALGVTRNWSCVCYDRLNIPAPGAVVAWAESSAVQFANSALGARTNRNSVMIDLCSAVLGKTPRFGCLLDENRRATVLVKVAAKKPDVSALGFVLGQKLVGKVPVIEHLELSRDDLKNLGAAMAAAGGVALFHVEGVTPEAPTLKDALQGKEPEQTITITEAELKGLRSFEGKKIDLVIYGCPQLTLAEAQAIGEHYVGKRVSQPVSFCVIPSVKEELKATPLYAKLLEAGIQVKAECPLAAWTVQLPPRKKILVNSGKCFYYLEGAEYGTTEDCLRTSGVS
jgi:cis-L-3-hydroxyproline dehydratase